MKGTEFIPFRLEMHIDDQFKDNEYARQIYKTSFHNCISKCELYY